MTLKYYAHYRMPPQKKQQKSQSKYSYVLYLHSDALSQCLKVTHSSIAQESLTYRMMELYFIALQAKLR